MGGGGHEREPLPMREGVLYDRHMKFIILSSSRGTTAKAVLDRVADGGLTMECLGLITDKDTRGCIDVARDAEFPVTIVSKQEGQSREEYDKALDAAIRAAGGTPDDTVICALGWMFILSPWFVHTWSNRIINVHPSLLPKHPGGHAITDALAAGDTVTGCSIHLIDEGVDTGPILLQKECPIETNDTEETLKPRVQELEKEWYPKVLQMIERGEMELP